MKESKAQIQKELQTLLTKSYNHIIRQGKPSICQTSGNCQYRHGKKKCAAGIFIKNYKEEMEGESWKTLVHNFTENFDPLAVKHAEFVDAVLQDAHDEAAHLAIYEEKLFIEGYKSCITNYIIYWNTNNKMSLKIPTRVRKLTK